MKLLFWEEAEGVLSGVQTDCYRMIKCLNSVMIWAVITHICKAVSSEFVASLYSGWRSYKPGRATKQEDESWPEEVWWRLMRYCVVGCTIRGCLAVWKPVSTAVITSGGLNSSWCGNLNPDCRSLCFPSWLRLLPPPPSLFLILAHCVLNLFALCFLTFVSTGCLQSYRPPAAQRCTILIGESTISFYGVGYPVSICICFF